MLHQPVAFFDKQASGSISSVLEGDVASIRSTLTDSGSELIQNSVKVVGYLSMMLMTSTELTVLAASSAPVFGLMSSQIGGQLLYINNIITTQYQSQWRNVWIRDVFYFAIGSQHQRCRGSQPKHVSNPA